MDWLKSLFQAIALAVLGLFLRKYRETAETKGALEERARQYAELEKARKEWDDIDAELMDFDKSADSLLNRSKGDRKPEAGSSDTKPTPK